MAANVYKSISLNDLNNRTVKQVSVKEKAKVNQIIANFIAYLKVAHS